MKITSTVSIRDEEIEISAIRSQGAGGQNVNKVSSAIHLRFDILASSLPEPWKERLLSRKDQRITREGIIVLKAQRFRTREKNLDDALQRLQQILQEAGVTRTVRRPTRPGKAAIRKRLDNKRKHSNKKAQRGKPGLND